jgi:hypothetical protein
MGFVINPRECSAIERICNDKRLRDLVTQHLGYRPRSEDIDVRLWWSFVTDLDNNLRASSGQTVHYHYHVHGFSFVCAFFYITDCDEYSGAHVLIRGSHKRKPLRMVLGSARLSTRNLVSKLLPNGWMTDGRYSDSEIYDIYGRDAEFLIEGQAGAGFVEDTSCFHKALAPIRSERLALQLCFA